MKSLSAITMGLLLVTGLTVFGLLTADVWSRRRGMDHPP